MAYKKKSLRKRNKKTSSFRKKKVSKVIKKYVKAQIHKNIENKHITTSSIQAVVGNSGTTGSLYYFSCIPSISQGITAQTRIGNVVKPKSVSLKLRLWNRAYVAVTNPQYHNTYRVIIFKFKKQNAFSTTDITGGLFRYGGSILGPQGNIGDMMYSLNTNDFNIIADRKVNLTTPQDSNVNMDKPCMKDFYFNLTRHYKKFMKYDDATTTVTNDNLYCMIFGVASDGGTTGTNGLGYYSYVLDFKFEDS